MRPDFSNTEIAFKHMSYKELRRAIFLFRFITKPFWVSFGKAMLKFAVFMRIPYGWAVRWNIFKHFCGGTSIENCVPLIEKLAIHNCFSILDYSAEGQDGEDNFDAVCNEIKGSVQLAKVNTSISFGVFKFTGMISFELLEKSSAGHTLNSQEQTSMNKAVSRADQIFQTASQASIPVFVDAEETWIQNAIDAMTLSMMEKHNTLSPVVFTTIQMYRRDGLQQLMALIDLAKEKGFVAGVKLVRGAYMEKERNRAQKLGYSSPIHSTKTNTDKMFNEAVKLCLHNLNHIHVCIATHNELSCLLVSEIMEEQNIDKKDKRIWFAQLYGMSDHITFNLSNNNYCVSKYLPYGPVQKVMPYLIRRAEENSSVAAQSNREIENFKKELQRRKKLAS
jgi:proline dehydrogenase